MIIKFGLGKFAERKLNEVKAKLRLIVLDYDGTLYSHHCSHFNHKKATEILIKILEQYHVAVITARGASAMKYVIPPVLKKLSVDKSLSRFFLAGGNGTTLTEIRNGKLKIIYNHGLTFGETQAIVTSYKKIAEYLGVNTARLMEKGTTTFTKFLKEDWTSLIPKDFFALSKQFKGQLFAEPSKISIALPNNPAKKKKLIKLLKQEIKKNYSVVFGDIDFHITKKLPKDGKIMAIEKIAKLLSINFDQLACFGDLPKGNDKGLLSFPYSFTNNQEFGKEKENLYKPPFILSSSSNSPVEGVYQAINLLLS